jgi:SAM-dependent methyltransferase
MQAYSAGFAKVYNMRWTRFAEQLAPRLQLYYENTALGRTEHSLLDVCCGTGQLALYFLDQGYQVTGIDLSEAMLEHARANASAYVVVGKAQFVQDDAAAFTTAGQFGLAVSTFDALNHLPDLQALSGCFQSVYAALLAGGTFIFDLNTRLGLRRWATISVEDSEEIMLVTRGLFDASQDRGYTLISGFLKVGENLYERFEETAFNHAFSLVDVQQALEEAGFRQVRFCRQNDLNTGLDDPEAESRIFVVCKKDRAS